jgi:hypothetical protein
VQRYLELQKEYGSRAEQRFADAIQALSKSDWHMGRDQNNPVRYCDWIASLTKSEEELSKWISRHDDKPAERPRRIYANELRGVTWEEAMQR